jgi:hypothetical protein
MRISPSGKVHAPSGRTRQLSSTRPGQKIPATEVVRLPDARLEFWEPKGFRAQRLPSAAAEQIELPTGTSRSTHNDAIVDRVPVQDVHLRPPYTRLTRRYGEPQVTNGPTPREESPYRVDPKIQRIDSGPHTRFADGSKP